MDTQEAKEAGFTPMQSIQVKIEKLESGQDWLKYVQRLTTGVVVSAIGIGFAVIFFMLRDTRQDIQKLDSRIDKLDSRIDKLESSIQDIRILLIQNARRQDTSKTSPHARRQAKR